MKASKIILLLVLTLAVGGFFAFDLGQYLNLEWLKAQQQALHGWEQANPWRAAIGFFAVYVLVTGLSLPGATILGLAAGAIFGWAEGTLIVSFASTLGATLAMLMARFLLRDWVQERFGDRLGAINEGVRKDGAFYLFGLRLVPIFPFFIINLVMGLTPMRTWTLYLGQPARDAGRHHGVSSMPAPNWRPWTPCRHPLAPAAGLLRPAGGVSAYRASYLLACCRRHAGP